MKSVDAPFIRSVGDDRNAISFNSLPHFVIDCAAVVAVLSDTENQASHTLDMGHGRRVVEAGVFNQLDAYQFKVAQGAGNRNNFMW